MESNLLVFGTVVPAKKACHKRWKGKKFFVSTLTKRTRWSFDNYNLELANLSEWCVAINFTAVGRKQACLFFSNVSS